MEIKNTTPYTYDALMAFSKHQAASPEGKRSHWFFLAAGIFNTVGLIRYGLHLLTGNRPPLYCLVFASLVFAEICFFLVLFAPQIRAKRIAKRGATVSYGFTEDGLTHNAINGETTSLSYDSIQKVTESPDYYFLYVAEADALIVVKNGFTEGTENDFRTLLRTVIDPKKLRIR